MHVRYLRQTSYFTVFYTLVTLCSDAIRTRTAGNGAGKLPEAAGPKQLHEHEKS